MTNQEGQIVVQKNLSTAASDVSAKETGLKAILKKPLKWLKGLGK